MLATEFSRRRDFCDWSRHNYGNEIIEICYQRRFDNVWDIIIYILYLLLHVVHCDVHHNFRPA